MRPIPRHRRGRPLRWWAVLGLVAVWLVLFGLGCRWFLDPPRRVLLLPSHGLVVRVGVVVARVRPG